jgi:hypothetical protein
MVRVRTQSALSRSIADSVEHGREHPRVREDEECQD